MKKIFIALFISLSITSCYEDYVMDYEYTAAYVAFQYDLRTFVYGEDVEVGFTTALGGVIANDRERKVCVSIDNELLTSDLSVFDPKRQASPFTAIDGLLGKAPIGRLSQGYVTSEIEAAGISTLEPLPKSYYTTSDLNSLAFKNGHHTACLYIYPTEEMFKDEKVLKPYYALGFVVTSSEVDSLILDKSFQIMAVKVENRFWGNWYHGGRRLVINNEDGSEVSAERYEMSIPQADSKNYILTTKNVNTVVTNKFSNRDGSLKLTFLENNEIKVEDPDGILEIRSILGQPSHHNGAKLIQDRKIYLNYAYSNEDGTTTFITDTLAFRNRIRDGINEWQDENTENYK